MAFPLFLLNQGYKYTVEPGKCCGTCKAEACIVIMGDNTTHVLKVTNPVSVHFWWTVSLFTLVSITFTSHVFSHVRLMLIQMGWTVSRGLNSTLSHEAEASGSNCDTEHWLSELKIKKIYYKYIYVNAMGYLICLRLWKGNTDFAQSVILFFCLWRKFLLQTASLKVAESFGTQ